MTPFRRSTLWQPATYKRDRGSRRLLVALGAAGAIACGLGSMLIAPRVYDGHGQSKVGIAHDLVRKLAIDDYANWSVAHPHERCPQRLALLRNPAVDPWGNAFTYTCDRRLIHGRAPIEIISAGEDGRFGTADDIRSSP